jgi:hypothetical protein
MAVCTLDLSHPCFLAATRKLQDDPEIQEALREIQRKVELEHTSCNRVVQPFGNGKFPELHGKIWKYDWGKSSASGRRSWRMVVVVPEPNVQPYRLIAGTIYAKSMTEQLPLKELAEIYTCVTLGRREPEQNEPPTPEVEFHRVPNGDGRTRSICMKCYEPVIVSEDIHVLDEAERAHRCDLASDSN